MFPIAVASNSMYPTYKKGDLVVYEKIENASVLEQNDIICYINESNKIIMHRVVNIENKNGKIYFTTKGDNVNTVDVFKVSQDKIIGRVKYIMNGLGYPSIWLYTLLNN